MANKDNFKGIEKFQKWLDENLKTKYGCYDLEAVLEDVNKQHGETGSCCYELSPYETKSGRPECYYYEVEIVHDEEYDTYETTYLFDDFCKEETLSNDKTAIQQYADKYKADKSSSSDKER